MRFPWVRRKDYEEVVYKLEYLLCHATGGRLSKASYPLRIMETEVYDYIQRCCDAEVEIALAERSNNNAE